MLTACVPERERRTMRRTPHEPLPLSHTSHAHAAVASCLVGPLAASTLFTHLYRTQNSHHASTMRTHAYLEGGQTGAHPIVPRCPFPDAPSMPRRAEQQ